MLHLRLLLLFALVPACLEPPDMGLADSTTDISSEAAATPDSKSDIKASDPDATKDANPDPGPSGPWTEPFVAASSPANPARLPVVPFGFVSETLLLFGTNMPGDKSTSAGTLALLNIESQVVHTLGPGRLPFEGDVDQFGKPIPRELRPVFGSDDGQRWMFGGENNAFLRNLDAGESSSLDLGLVHEGHYAMNAAGTMLVTLKDDGVLQVRRPDGTVIRGVANVEGIIPSTDRQHLFWVADGHFFADTFDDDVGDVDGTLAAAVLTTIERVPGGKYVTFERPKSQGWIVYDIEMKTIAMDTQTAVPVDTGIQRLDVVNGAAVWVTYGKKRVWTATLPNGTPEIIPGAIWFDVLPGGLLLEMSDGSVRFQPHGEEALGPDVSAYGRPWLGTFVDVDGTVALAPEKTSPWTVSWVDVVTGIVKDVPNATLYSGRPITFGAGLVTYVDTDLFVALQQLSTGITLQMAQGTNSGRNTPTGTDDGRVLLWDADGKLVVVDGDLNIVILAANSPEYAVTKDNVVVCVQVAGENRELLVMRLP